MFDFSPLIWNLFESWACDLELDYHHGVAEGVEAVFFGDGFLIGAVDEVFSGEGGDEHD